VIGATPPSAGGRQSTGGRQARWAAEAELARFRSECADTDEVPGEARCAIYRIGDYVEGVCKLR
jgi:hypothetical protein